MRWEVLNSLHLVTFARVSVKVIEKWGLDSKLKQLLEQFRVEIQVRLPLAVDCSLAKGG